MTVDQGKKNQPRSSRADAFGENVTRLSPFCWSQVGPAEVLGAGRSQVGGPGVPQNTQPLAGTYPGAGTALAMVTAGSHRTGTRKRTGTKGRPLPRHTRVCTHTRTYTHPHTSPRSSNPHIRPRCSLEALMMPRTGYAV